MSQNEIQKLNILGVGISVVNMNSTLSIIGNWPDDKDNKYICVTGVHGVIESLRNEKIKEIHNNAGLVTPDGMPLVWLSRLHGFQDMNRVYGPDLLLMICGHSSFKNCKHFFYGSTSSVLDKLAENLKMKFPGINIVGTFAPPFRPLTLEEDSEVIKMINQTNPDFLWIGLSTPKQEIWMSNHIGKIHKPIMIGVGAAFDFQAGVKKQAPMWMQQSGLEWLFRLLTEPKRLWQRYLINNTIFIILIALQLLGIKKYSLTNNL